MKELTQYIIEKANFLIKKHIGKNTNNGFDVIIANSNFEDFINNSIDNFPSESKKEFLKFLKGTNHKSACSVKFNDYVLHIHRYASQHYIEFAVLLSKSAKWPSEIEWQMSIHNYKDSRFKNNPDDLYCQDMYEQESQTKLKQLFHIFISNNKTLIEKTLNITK